MNENSYLEYDEPDLPDEIFDMQDFEQPAEELDYIRDCNCTECILRRGGRYEIPGTINTAEIPITEILPETQASRESKGNAITASDMAHIMVDVLEADVEAMGMTIEVRYGVEVHIHVPEVTLLYDGQQFTYQDFNCKVYFSQNGRSIYPEISIRGENLHPHMSSEGRFCMGDNHSALANFIEKGEFHSFLAHLLTTLNTYSPGGAPYRRLGYTSNCDGCGDSIDEDSTYECDERYCDNDHLGSCCIYQCHAYRFNYRGHGNFCSDHVESCSGCQEYYCDEHIYHCDRCSDAICADHRYSCSGCGSSFCESHISSCDNCGNSYCENCLDSGMCESCLEESEDYEQEETETMENDTTEYVRGTPEEFGYEQLPFAELLTGEVTGEICAGGSPVTLGQTGRTLPPRDRRGRFISAVRASTEVSY